MIIDTLMPKIRIGDHKTVREDDGGPSFLKKKCLSRKLKVTSRKKKWPLKGQSHQCFL